MSNASLVNHGFIVKRKLTGVFGDRNVVIVGCARGGTSIVAGLLYHLSFPMPGAHDPVFEDLRLSLAVESQDEERISKIVNEYNSKFGEWGWKRPSAIDNLEFVNKSLTNPVYIFIFRDVLSIANRNRISMAVEVIDSMQRALNEYSKATRFIAENDVEYMMCSVEKIKQYPEIFTKGIIEFLGLDVSGQQVEAALDFVQPEPGEYLEASRINRGEGQIGGVRDGVVFGWAAWVYRQEMVSVEVFLNSQSLGFVNANDYREHSASFKNRRHGYCGYKFDLNPFGVRPGDVVAARIKSEVKYLLGSEYVLTEDNLK